MSLEAVIRTIVGAEHVLLDPELRASFETDWTGRFGGPARSVVRPADTAQVSQVLAACSDARVPVVVQGGNTGLVGGGVPESSGERPVLLLTTRLTELGQPEPASRQILAGSGVTLASLTARARSAGLDFGVDLAARDTATVGGMVATNAGGIRVIRYGSMREQVRGFEAVLVDGRSVNRLAGLDKDSTGYDMGHLLAGSEGTLAVITRLRLRLVAPSASWATALVAVRDATGATELLAGARRRLPGLAAAELIFADGLELVSRHLGAGVPLAGVGGAYVLIEAAGDADPLDDLLGTLESSEQVLDATVASSAADRARLWKLREYHAEAINAIGVPVKLDVSVPAAEIGRLVELVPDVVAGVAPKARVILFGHLAEANLHVNVLNAVDEAEAVTDAVLQLVAELGGSISSEHGIGRAKTRWLHLTRSSTELAVMRSIKSAFDPHGLLNPGVLLPAESSAAG
jgi:FAD/FMN-containing dehydrogenase